MKYYANVIGITGDITSGIPSFIRDEYGNIDNGDTSLSRQEITEEQYNALNDEQKKMCKVEKE